jgi:hypothetical protein
MRTVQVVVVIPRMRSVLAAIDTSVHYRDMVASAITICANCRFFRPLPPDEEQESISGDPTQFGRCLRFPPTFIEEGCLNGEWPIVFNQSWCGEHEHPSNDL